LKEIKVGAAKESMFKVPGDSRKVNSRMEMMDGMESRWDKRLRESRGKDGPHWATKQNGCYPKNLYFLKCR
jgi:hypothetical protein